MNESGNSKLISAVAILLLLAIAAAVFNQREKKSASYREPRAQTKQVASPKIHPAGQISPGYAALLDQALLEPDPQKRGIAFGTLFSQWLAEDQDGAIAYLKGLPAGSQYGEGLFMALQKIGANDPGRAVTLAGEMANTTEQKQIFSLLFSQFASRDLTNTLSLLPLTPAGESRANALRAIASVWSQKDMDSAIDWGKSLRDPDEKNIALETSLTDLAKSDPKKAFVLALQNLSGDSLEYVAASGLRGMLQTDPQSVSQLITQLPPGELQTGLTMDVARALMTQQPETAISWLGTLPPGDLRQNALNNILDVWNTQSLASVAQFILQMPAGADQDAAVKHMSRDFGTANPEDAIRWAQNLPDGSTRNTAIVNVISGWAQNDPLAATVWAQNLPPDSPVRTQALQGAFSYWQLIDAAAANNFFNSLSKAEQAQLFGTAK